MDRKKDFQLNLNKVKRSTKNEGASPMVTSKSLRTSGYITGVLMTFPIKTFTYGCHIFGK